MNEAPNIQALSILSICICGQRVKKRLAFNWSRVRLVFRALVLGSGLESISLVD